MQTKRLLNKVIVVSGGTSGVGRTSCEEFANEGARVVIGGRNEEAALQSIRLMESFNGEGIFVHTELEKVEDCKNLFEEAIKAYGKVDGFFNYAGITSISPLDTCNEDTFNKIMNINFRACFFCCQQAIKIMQKNGGGSIVLTGSAHAWGGQKDRAVYACSKGVLLTLMEHIAHNYASENIRCNYLTLGWTPTEGEVNLRKMQGETESELRKRAAKILPMGRMLESIDYVEALIYLMSDAASMMTGSIFRMTGGEYI
ncbi:Dihydroanticapsin 7-dehydrogenase [bioreactor metagenome]|uniref:Dihydroanticapsin 7-dehydrogenase n=1 Tax=bioreactor metagenome TaxID=1076179 RepID=A0A644TV42_9ZZZZ